MEPSGGGVETGRLFRLFVSSTFDDWREEREALRDTTFRDLRELCERAGASFQAIDLRWSVTDAASRRNMTMGICLEEVDRCRRLSRGVNFVALMGDRYGWCPAPATIPGDDFESLRNALSAGERDLLEALYVIDENARHVRGDRRLPEYVLHQAESSDQDWTRAEPALVKALRRAAAQAALPPERLVMYGGSATAQEIHRGLLYPPASPAHVVCFRRRIVNFDAMVADAPRNGSAALYFDRDRSHGHASLDAEARAAQLALIERVRVSVGEERVRIYDAMWTGSGLTNDHVRTLCTDVSETLRAVIERSLSGNVSLADQEKSAHLRFGEERSQHFLETPLVASIADRLSSGDTGRPMVVCGAAGSGKSAAMAHLSRRVRRARPSAVVVERFIGATPSSMASRALADSICAEIGAAFDQRADAPEDRGAEAVVASTLRLAREDRSIVLFLDGLDQLGLPGESLPAWIPAAPPPHVRLVVSRLGRQEDPEIRGAFPNAEIVQLGAMAQDDAGRLLDTWLQAVDAPRALTSPQRERLLKRFDDAEGRPLFLKLAFEEARRWRSFTPVEEQRLGGDIAGMVQVLFDRLSAPENFGTTVTARALGLLAVAWTGLSESELLETLSQDGEVLRSILTGSPRSPDPAGEIPPVVIWRLLAEIRPYLAEREADGAVLLRYYHGEVARAAERAFLAEGHRQERHRSLANFFSGQPLLFKGFERPNLRALSELPAQLLGAEGWSGAQRILTDIQFIMAKCSAHRVAELEADYTRARAAYPRDDGPLAEWNDFVTANAYLLERNQPFWSPHLTLLQLACETAAHSEVADAANGWLAASGSREIRLERSQQVHSAAPIRVLECPGEYPTSLDVTPQGRLLFHSDRVVHTFDIATGIHKRVGAHHAEIRGLLQISGGRMVTWSTDGCLMIWDVESARGWLLGSHSGAVRDVCRVDGDQLLSWGTDGTLRLWDVDTPREVRVLRWHDEGINGVAHLSGGRLACWAGKTVAVGSIHADDPPFYFHRHESMARGALCADEEVFVSWANDPCVWVWGRHGESRILTDQAHRPLVYGAVAAGRGRILTWGGDRSLALWRLADGECLIRKVAHDLGINVRAVELPGDRIATLGDDGAVHVWATSTLDRNVSFTAHQGRVTGAVAVDEKTLLTWSDDGSIALCGLDDGKQLRFVHGGEVSTAVAVSNDRLASCGLDSAVRVWSIERHRQLSRGMQRHRRLGGAVLLAPIDLVTWESPDQVQGDAKLFLWDAATGAPAGYLEGHEADVRGAVSLTRGRLASWDENGILHVWNVADRKSLHRLAGHGGPIHGVLPLSEGRVLAAHDDGELQVWNTTSGRALERLPSDQIGRQFGASLSVDGRILSWLSDGTASLWSPQSGRITRFPPGGRGGFSAGAKLLDDGRLVIWSPDGLSLWDSSSGGLLSRTTKTDGWFAQGAPDAAIVGGQIAVWNIDPYSPPDPVIRLFDLGDLRHTGRLVGHRDAVTAGRCLSDNRLLSRSDDEGVLCLWNTATAALEQKITVQQATTEHSEWLARTARVPLAPEEENQALWRWEIGRAVGVTSKNESQPVTVAWNGADQLRSFRILPTGKLLVLSDTEPIVLQCRRGVTDVSWDDYPA